MIIEIDTGTHTLTLAVPATTDIDGRIVGTCTETGERFAVCGWNVDVTVISRS
jgi:hypothetical protein